MKPSDRIALTGSLFALGSTAIWSGNYIIARSLSGSIPPVSLALLRWSVAVVAILPFAAKHLLSERRTILRHLPYLAITAFLGVTLFNTLVYFAGRSTTAVNLSLISITFPIFVVVLSALTDREAPTARTAAGIVLVVAGVVTLITRGDPGAILALAFAPGDLLMLVASLVFAVYSLLLRRRPKDLGIWSFQASTFVLGTIMLLPAFLLQPAPSTPPETGMRVALAVLYLGIFASLTAFILWNRSVELLGPSRAGMLYYTMPLFGGLWSTLFLGEGITTAHLASAVLIVTGILLANPQPKKTDRSGR